MTLLACRRPDLATLDRYAGTRLSGSGVRVTTGPAWLRAASRFAPVPLSLLRRAGLMRAARRIAHRYDAVLSLDNEVDVGRRAVQYVHFPWGFWPRPDVDLRWYHLGPLVKAYYALAYRVSEVDRDRIAANATLVNSDWTGRRFVETYGGSPRTVYPPATLSCAPLPWEERRDRFVVAGRFSPEKELEKVIAIVEGVRQLGHDVSLLLVGTRARRGTAARYADRILRLARERAGWLEVRLDVPRNELEELLASSRWGLHGMSEEHYGMAVAEMVVAGCVPFVPNGGGQVEIVGDAAELRYGSVADAVAKIDAVRRDAGLLARIRAGLAARAPALSAERFEREIVEAVEKA